MTHSPWLPATKEDPPGARHLRRCTGSHVSGRRQVPEGSDPHLPQRSEIHPAARPGGFNERPTVGRHDRFRGGVSDPSQREPCTKAGGGAAPGGTPCARDLGLEFEEVGLPTFNSPQANQGAALARLQQANPSPEANAAMAYVWVATAMVEERSAASKSATSTSSRHSRSRSNRPAHSKLPTIQEEVNQP
jgi:hypothetical protein